jgi:hypothetical protein
MGLVSLARAAWPGLGLCGESFLIFSIGKIPPLWDAVFFTKADEAQQRDAVLHMLSYSVVSGVIIGMVVLGYAANKIGCRVGSLITASLMVLGAIGLTTVALVGGEQHRRANVQIANDNASVETAALLEETIASIFHWLGISFFALGLAVGDEYPLSLASAAETSMVSICHDGTDESSPSSQQPARITQTNENNMTQKKPAAIDSPPRTAEEDAPTNHVRTESWNNRGRQMQIVFTMQGVGMFLHCVLLTLLQNIFMDGTTSSRV